MTTPTAEQLAAWRHLQWATALIMNRFRSDLAEAGLPIEEFDALVHLAWEPTGTLPLQELTASMVLATALSRSGLTRILDRMEANGLIRRKLNPHDRRRFDVVLTAKGKRRFDEVWPPHQEGIGRYFAAPLTQRDIDELDRIVDKLIRHNEAEMGLNRPVGPTEAVR